MANLLKYSSSFFDPKALCNSIAIVFINFVEETQHVVSDVRATHSKRLANVIDEAGPFLFSQDFSIKSTYLLKFFRGVDELVSSCQSFHSGKAWPKVRISFGANIHRIEIVCHLFLLVFLDIHDAILDKIVYMEWTIDGDLVIVWTKSV